MEYEIRNADSPVGFHSVVRKAVVTECSMTPEPCNRHALVQCRWRAPPAYDDVFAALGRMKKALENLKLTPPKLKPADAVHVKHLTLGTGPAYVYGTLPRAMLQRNRTPFGEVVLAFPWEIIDELQTRRLSSV